MKDIRVSVMIDSDVLIAARKFASEKGMTISDLVSCQLKQAICVRKNYSQARRRALARLRRGFDLQWKRPGSRVELHER